MPINVRMTQPGALFSDAVAPLATLTPREARARRETLFAESFGVSARRRAAAAAGLLGAARLAALPACLDLLLRESFIKAAGLPAPESALSKPDGLCGLVSDASPEAVLEGLHRGLYPSANWGPPRWWSPGTRSALRPASCKLTNEARRLLRREALEFEFDADFDASAAALSRSRWGFRAGRLRSPRGLNLLAGLADLGFAHALDAWDAKGRRVATAHGVVVGGVFTTLGVAGVDRDHAEAALVVLNRHLRVKGFALHEFAGGADMGRLGFLPVPRDAFLAVLRETSGAGRAGRWRADPALRGRMTPNAGNDDREIEAGRSRAA